jgi:hypothetical protein
MFDSRIFYLQLGHTHRDRPQIVDFVPRRAPRPFSERRAARPAEGR